MTALLASIYIEALSLVNISVGKNLIVPKPVQTAKTWNKDLEDYREGWTCLNSRGMVIKTLGIL